MIETSGVFIHVFMGTVIAHSRTHYFVLTLWPLVLTFSIFSTDIPYGLRSSSVEHVFLEHEILFPRTGILCEFCIDWSRGWTICKVCESARGSLYELSLRAVPVIPIGKLSLRALSVTSSCEHYRRDLF